MEPVFVDTETTGLDPDRHEIWEVGLIEANGTEHHWFLPVENLHLADTIALSIGGFWDRYPTDWIGKHHKYWLKNEAFAREFYFLTQGKMIFGAVPSFDEERLRKVLHNYNMIHGWHYHLGDIESMSVGYMKGVANADVPLPWKWEDVKGFFTGQMNNDSEVFDPEDAYYAKHTAIGDARVVRALYRIITESTVM